MAASPSFRFRDIDAAISSLQFINGGGAKHFLVGGRVGGWASTAILAGIIVTLNSTTRRPTTGGLWRRPGEMRRTVVRGSTAFPQNTALESGQAPCAVGAGLALETVSVPGQPDAKGDCSRISKTPQEDPLILAWHLA
jgi:hypothetical protein